MPEAASLNITIDGDESGLVAATNRSEAALNDLGSTATRTGGTLGTASNRAKTFGTQASKAAAHTGNLTAQFNDIGLMLASGQSPLLLAAQQGTQINQVMDQMSRSGASRMGALKAAFLQAVSPANLLTFAIIATGAALFQFGLKAIRAGRETQSLSTAIEDMEDLSVRAGRAADILAMSVEDLGEKYGDAAERVRELALEELVFVEAAATRELRSRAGEVRNLSRQFSGFVRHFRDGAAVLRADTGALLAIQREFGLTGEEAQALGAQFRDLRGAGSFEEQQAVLERIKDSLDAAGVSMGTWPESLEAAVVSMNAVETAAIETAAAIARGVAAAQGLGGDDDGDDIISKGAFGKPEDGDDDFSREALQERLDALEEGFLSEEELQFASFERQQAMLEEALERKLLTQDQFQDLMAQSAQAHADILEDIDASRHSSTLQEAAGFFGAMEGALQGSNKRLIRIAKVFGAVEALINAWRAYTQVLADPTLPFYAKFAAAAAVLGAGLGAVSAIQGVSESGGGGRGGAGAASAAGASVGAGAGGQSVSRNVAIQLEGDSFSGDSIRNLINKINEAVEDGAVIRIV